MNTLTQTMLHQPVFLVGAERSGTTMLRLMLDHHPKLSWCSEFEYSVRYVGDEGQWPNLNSVYDQLLAHRVFKAHEFQIDRSLDYPHLVNSFLCQKKQRDDKPIVGATCHRWFDRLFHIWPDTRMIHLVRDGRDVARSCIGMGWAGNVYCGADKWIESNELWAKVCEKLPQNRRIEVQFEQLVCDPQPTLQKICEFIGVTFDSAMLEYDRDTTYSKPDPKLTRQWRRKLNNREIQQVESRIGDQLIRCGYELSGLSALRVSNMQQRKLRLHNWWVCLNFRRKRYGLTLWLSDLVVRRIGSATMRKRMQMRINHAVTQHLK